MNYARKKKKTRAARRATRDVRERRSSAEMAACEWRADCVGGWSVRWRGGVVAFVLACGVVGVVCGVCGVVVVVFVVFNLSGVILIGLIAVGCCGVVYQGLNSKS
jgi:hypothetical protein